MTSATPPGSGDAPERPPAAGLPPAGWRPAPPPPPPPGGTPPAGWGPPPAQRTWGAPPPPGPPPGSPAQLRPLGVAELLDAIFSLYRRNFLLIVAIAAILEVPAALLSLLPGREAFDATNDLSTQLKTSPATGTLTPEQSSAVGHDIAVVTGYGLLLVAVQILIVQPLVLAATTRAVSDRYLGREATLGSSYRAALRRLRALIARSLWLLLIFVGVILIPAVVALVVGVGTQSGGAAVGALVLALVVVVPVLVFILVRYTLSVPAIVVEELSGWEGLRRSAQLVRGTWWRIFGIWLLLTLIAAVFNGVVGGLLSLPAAAFGPDSRFAVNQVAGAVAQILLAPITLIGLTLLYYDVRIRREAFDLEVLAASL